MASRWRERSERFKGWALGLMAFHNALQRASEHAEDLARDYESEGESRSPAAPVAPTLAGLVLEADKALRAACNLADQTGRPKARLVLALGRVGVALSHIEAEDLAASGPAPGATPVPPNRWLGRCGLCNPSPGISVPRADCEACGGSGAVPLPPELRGDKS